MKYLNKTIVELHELLIKKEVTPYDLALEAIENAKQDTNNAFETICEKEALEFASSLKEVEEDNYFWGIPFVAKDNFSTKGILTTGSSDILKDYVPVFDATVIKKLKEKKAVLIGKTTLDELAMGGQGMTSHKGYTYNPYDPSHTYMIGGSSCGSASAMAGGIIPFALGSDTGDSVRKPATFGGLVGFKPSWGRISRYGLFPFAPSMDHVAYFTRSVEDSALALSVLEGQDDFDMTSSYRKTNNYFASLSKDLKGKKIAVIKELMDCLHNETILNAFNESLSYLKDAGAEVDYVSMDRSLLGAIYGTYLVISCSEATSNNACLDGVKYGPRNNELSSYEEIMVDARSKGFGSQVKRRFVVGSYSLLAENQKDCFLKAQKARRIIVNKVNEILSSYDAIYLPASGKTKNPFAGEKSTEDSTIIENYLAIANFAGLPSLTLPIGKDEEFPLGANITCRAFDEQAVLDIAYAIESRTGLKNIVAKGDK